MRAAMIIATVALALLTQTGKASADPADEKRFEKLISKYAVPHTTLWYKFKPKAGCVCQNGSSGDGLPGVVIRKSGGDVACGLPQFVGGELYGVYYCYDWIILAK